MKLDRDNHLEQGSGRGLLRISMLMTRTKVYSPKLVISQWLDEQKAIGVYFGNMEKYLSINYTGAGDENKLGGEFERGCVSHTGSSLRKEHYWTFLRRRTSRYTPGDTRDT